MAMLALAVRTLILVELAVCCGILTHTEIAHRAHQFYNNDAFGPGEVRRILDKWQGAFQAGAVFPDAFYNSLCGSHKDDAEDMHWVPWMKAAFDYFRRTYPEPFLGNAKAEKLLAFLLGVASHQTSDVSWHGLRGLRDGLLPAVARTDFDNDNGAAHTFIDLGGDIIGSYQWDIKYGWRWYIPSKDVFNIIVEYNRGNDRGLNPSALELCAGWLLLLRSVEKIRGTSIAYPVWRQGSVFFNNEMENYFLGGMSDMTAWTQIVWDRYIVMLRNGTCDSKISPMHLTCTPSSSLDGQQGDSWSIGGKAAKFSPGVKAHNAKEYAKMKREYFDLIEKEVTTEKMKVARDRDGAWISIRSDKSPGEERALKETQETRNSPREKKRLLSMLWGFLRHLVSPPAPYASVASASIYSPRDNSNFGYALALADLTGDGVDDLVVGSPTYYNDGLNHFQGCVFVVFGKAGDEFPSGDIEGLYNIKACDEIYQHSRFGHSLEVLDRNGDGILDILVGAPSAGMDKLTYHGEVFQLLGYRSPSGRYQLRPPTRITQGEPPADNRNLGWAILAKPGSQGFVTSARHFTSSGDTSLRQSGAVFDAADFGTELASGRSEYEWFGSSMAFLSGSKSNMLAVGSPIWTDGKTKSLGKVSVFDLGNGNALVKEIRGNRRYQQMGHAVAAGVLRVNGEDVEVLAIGAPTDGARNTWKRYSGSVKILRQSDFSEITDLSISDTNSRFGASLVITPTKQLLVGSPRYKGNAGIERGALFLYDDVGRGGATMKLESPYGRKLGLFSQSLAGNGALVVAASPRSSPPNGGEAAGAVHIFRNSNSNRNR